MLGLVNAETYTREVEVSCRRPYSLSVYIGALRIGEGVQGVRQSHRSGKMNILNLKNIKMAMWGNHIQRVKIVINDNIIEQVTDFKYLGYRISE